MSAGGGAPPRRSALLVALFSAYARRYVARHFHGVWVQGPAALPPGPVLVVMNHPSWWDPLVGLLLAPRLGRRLHAAPWDAAALARYGLWERLGAFAVGPGLEGTARFLVRGRAALARDDAALWVTAQGRFVDARARPPGLLPGVGHLARAMDRGVALPLALEYAFWDERLPEAFARFGPPLPARDPARPVGDGTAAASTARLEAALAATQDALAADVAARDPGRFTRVLAGRAGVGGVYDLWRRLRAWARGEAPHLAHAGPPP